MYACFTNQKGISGQAIIELTMLMAIMLVLLTWILGLDHLFRHNLRTLQDTHSVAFHKANGNETLRDLEQTGRWETVEETTFSLIPMQEIRVKHIDRTTSGILRLLGGREKPQHESRQEIYIYKRADQDMELIIATALMAGLLAQVDGAADTATALPSLP